MTQELKPIYGVSSALLGGFSLRENNRPLRFVAGGNEVIRIEADGAVFWNGTQVKEGDDPAFRSMMKQLYSLMMP